MSRHHMQRARQKNISLIQQWIKEASEQAKKEEKEFKIDLDSLMRKACLVIGCTRRKAIEYIKVIYGEDAFYDE